MKHQEDLKTALANLRNGHGLTPEQTLDVISQLLLRADRLEHIAAHLLHLRISESLQDGRSSRESRMLEDLILNSPDGE